MAGCQVPIEMLLHRGERENKIKELENQAKNMVFSYQLFAWQNRFDLGEFSLLLINNSVR